LSQTYGISHVSVEKALAILREAGVIESHVGKGSFVKRD
jgi:DNA-binding GntR family transcriptional regulator